MLDRKGVSAKGYGGKKALKRYKGPDKRKKWAKEARFGGRLNRGFGE